MSERFLTNKCIRLVSAKPAPAKGIDIHAEGTIDGTPIYEFDLAKLDVEQKPWRKPGRFNLATIVTQ